MQNFPWKLLLPRPKGAWVIPVSIDISEADKRVIEGELRRTLEKLGPGIKAPEVKAVPISGEWQGAGPLRINGPPTTKEQFELQSATTKDGPVILYLHGGGFVAGSSESERRASVKLCALCRCRAFSVNYRLAPQHPFPAAVVDVLHAYKFLIDPPEGAIHSAIRPEKIIIAGASAGVLRSPSFADPCH